MNSISAKDAFISPQYFQEADQNSTQKDSLDNSMAMWEYRNRNTIDGVPVDQTARDLYINNIEQAREATQTLVAMHVWTGYISPKEQDLKSRLQYQNLMQDSANNKIFIIQQQKYFCADIGKVMYIVTYAEVSKHLHPRYSHLKQENN